MENSVCIYCASYLLFQCAVGCHLVFVLFNRLLNEWPYIYPIVNVLIVVKEARRLGYCDLGNLNTIFLLSFMTPKGLFKIRVNQNNNFLNYGFVIMTWFALQSLKHSIVLWISYMSRCNVCGWCLLQLCNALHLKTKVNVSRVFVKHSFYTKCCERHLVLLDYWSASVQPDTLSPLCKLINICLLWK